jgi:cell division protein FtsL
MIRLPTLFWLIVVSATGFAMFAVKYEVQGLADQLTRTIKHTDDVERDIRVLDAEWAYLNRPAALAPLNQRFLSLVPIATKQLRTSVADIPMRPAPPPAPAPAIVTVAASLPTTVAAATPPKEPVPQPAAPPSPTAQTRPAENAKPVVTAALEAPVAAHSVRPAVTRLAARSAATHRAASLNELIAAIVESR